MNAPLPALYRVRQRFPAPKLADVAGTLRRELAASGVRCSPAAPIAIAVGSRGIANLALIVRETVAWVKEQGAQPFIVPAMGSHGGATADGQREVLASFGITEAGVGAPIRSAMEVVELPAGDLPVKVYCDKQAAAAAGTIVINRIKPHTSFQGRYESGLMKMLAVGLGKLHAARAVHALGVAALREVMPRVARQVLQHGNVMLGIAIVENAADETMLVRAVPAAEIPAVEPELLTLARQHQPRLPVSKLDILIVDEIGKDISGTGLDTNVIGRLKIRGQPEPVEPDIAMIVVRDLTAATHGNAYGIGLADVMTRRLFAKIDFRATYENSLTTGFLERTRLPLIAETDQQAVECAVRGAALGDVASARIIRVRNTLHLDEIHVTAAVLAEIRPKPEIEVREEVGWSFDEQGTLQDF
jgi:hypothetical protein